MSAVDINIAHTSGHVYPVCKCVNTCLRKNRIWKGMQHIKAQTHCNCVTQFDLAVTGAVNCVFQYSFQKHNLFKFFFVLWALNYRHVIHWIKEMLMERKRVQWHNIPYDDMKGLYWKKDIVTVTINALKSVLDSCNDMLFKCINSIYLCDKVM